MTEPAMSQLGHELAANEVPSMPPSPAEHMPPAPDPMQILEPVWQALDNMHHAANQFAQALQDAKFTLTGFVITAHMPEPLRAPDDKHRKKDDPPPQPEPESEDNDK